MSEVVELLTRDLSSGRIHKRWRPGGDDTHALASYEACNADSSGGYEIIDDNAIADVPHDALCKRCFPPASSVPAAEA